MPGRLLTLLTSAAPLAAPSTTPPIDGPNLLAYWNLTGLAADAQEVADLLGGRTLRLGSTAGADTNDPAVAEDGLSFGGDDYATTTSGFADEFAAGLSFLWVGRMPLAAGNRMFYLNHDATNTVAFAGAQVTADGSLLCTSGQSVSTYPAAIPADTWCCIAGATGWGAGNTSLYKNGVVLDLANDGGLSAQPTAGQLEIARAMWYGTPYYGQHQTAALLLYGRRLTADEMAANYGWLKATLAGKGVLLP